VKDFTKEIVVLPTSAVTGEGILDIISILSGLAQKYLEKRLQTTGRPMGNILEIKQEKGLGATADAIIYDGVVREGDTIVMAGMDGPIVTKIRCLLKPLPLREICAEKKFMRVKEVEAASGVKIAAPGIENAIPGSTLLVSTPENLQDTIAEIQKEKESIEFVKDDTGVVVKTDALGTLEAMVKMLNERKIKVKKAKVGDINRSDITSAEEVKTRDPYLGVVLGFNVRNGEEALCSERGVKVITGDIVYRILEEYEVWAEEERKRMREAELSKLHRPAKFQIIPGFVFRASKPAIVGVEVLGGTLTNHIEIMREEGKSLGEIKQLEIQGAPVKEARKGAKLAVRIDGPTVGRQIKEGDLIFSSITEPDYKKLVKFLDLLDESEKEVLNEVVAIKRKERKTWGMLESL
jgi:translation initiation factor 5B